MALAGTFDLATLDGGDGFYVDGAASGDTTQFAASGDLNGDGYPDLVFSSLWAHPAGRLQAGAIWVVFGHAPPFAQQFNLGGVDGTNGFRIDGLAAGDGLTGASLGDFNGDGVDDLLLAARFADPLGRDLAGEAYLIYGKAGGFGTVFDLASLNGQNGVRIPGPHANAQLSGASSIGDVNGDGIDDFSLSQSTPNAGGRTYIVYGRGEGFGASLDLAALSPAQGLVFEGAPLDNLQAARGMGDINGDGIHDFLVVAAGDRIGHVIFGQAGGHGQTPNLQALGADGFRVTIPSASGNTLIGTAAGDFNGDGIGDLLFGAWGADPGGRANAGEAYLVFGRASAFPASIDLSTLGGSVGFKLEGAAAGDLAGITVSSAGDVNGDGLDEIFIAAPKAGANPQGVAPGQGYLVWGSTAARPASANLGALGAGEGVQFPGVDPAAQMVGGGAGGDVDGDGLSDLAIGGPGVSPGGVHEAGRSYIVFGQSSATSTAGADTFVGGPGRDNFNGLGGDDLVQGGAGDDVFRGGSGTDTSVYRAAASSFDWWGRPDGTWRVKDLRVGNPEGTDTLTDFESLQFADKTVKLTGLTTAEKLTEAYTNVLRNTATGSELTFLDGLIAEVNGATKTLSAAIGEIVQKADGTTAVATLSYQFFAGFTPSKGGFDYLVSPQGPNPNNINSAYYQNFSFENRYINFAVNLGKLGEGAAGFQAEYGQLTLFAATKAAYMEIFGGTVTDSKIGLILDSDVGNGLTRKDYFAVYGGDGLQGIGTKAAMVGWLLTEAAKADVGMYARSSNAFLADLADGAETLIDLIGDYGRADYVFNG